MLFRCLHVYNMPRHAVFPRAMAIESRYAERYATIRRRRCFDAAISMSALRMVICRYALMPPALLTLMYAIAVTPPPLMPLSLPLIDTLFAIFATLNTEYAAATP